MYIQEMNRPVGTALAAPIEDAAVMELTVRPEAAVSGAPQYRPECVGAALLLALLLASPKPPKDKS